jgi:hypothetical protein
MIGLKTKNVLILLIVITLMQKIHLTLYKKTLIFYTLNITS